MPSRPGSLRGIDLCYLPALGFSIETSTLFMMLRAFAFGLVFSRNANPDANWFEALFAIRSNHAKNYLTESFNFRGRFVYGCFKT